MSKALRRVQCAAITNGCLSALIWETDTPSSRADAPMTQADLRHLELNGWRLDHGAWVCGLEHRKPGAVRRFLFLAGDAHGRELDLPAYRSEWRVPIIGGGDLLYVRRRFGVGMTKKLRSVFVPSNVDGMEAERLLKDHLLKQWINGDPDNA